MHFHRSPNGAIAVTDGKHDLEVGSGQLLIPGLLLEMDALMRRTREDWVRRAVDIDGYPRLVSNARVLGGAPVIKGTRVETAFVSHIAQELETPEILRLYPYIDEEGLNQALEFERAA